MGASVPGTSGAEGQEPDGLERAPEVPDVPAPAAAEPPGTSAADRTTGASLVRGGMWTMVAFVLPQVFTLAVSIPAARLLGAADMGRLSYIGFLAASVAACASLGLPTALQRFLGQSVGANRPDQARALADWGLRWGGVGGAIGFVVIASMQLITYPDLALAWWLTAAYTAFAILHSFVAQVLFALQRWRTASILGLVTSGLTVLTSLAALLAGHGIVGMRAAEAVSALVGLLATAYYARGCLRGLGAPARQLGRLRSQVLSFAGVASIGILLDIFLNKRSELFFLQVFSSDEELAYYSIGFAVVAATMRIPQAVAGIVMPAVATLAGAGQLDRIRSGYTMALRLMLHLTLPLAAVTVALGPAAVRLLYGEGYATAGTVLAIIAPASVVLTATSSVASATLTGLGRIGLPLVCGVVGLVVTVGLDLALIPRWHAVGAAAGNAGGQLVAASLIIFVASRSIRARWRTWRLLRTLAVAAVVGLVSWSVLLLEGPLGLPVAAVLSGAAAVAAYLLLATSMRIIGRAEGTLLADAVGALIPVAGRLIRRMRETG